MGQINHSWGTFYWLIISQLRFHKPTSHANSSTAVITHTLKIFIIKRIRLCSLNIFFPGSPFRGSAWLPFISTQPSRSMLLSLSPILHQPAPFFVSWFSAAIIIDPVSLLLCKVTGSRGLKNHDNICGSIDNKLREWSFLFAALSTASGRLNVPKHNDTANLEAGVLPVMKCKWKQAFNSYGASQSSGSQRVNKWPPKVSHIVNLPPFYTFISQSIPYMHNVAPVSKIYVKKKTAFQPEPDSLTCS